MQARNGNQSVPGTSRQAGRKEGATMIPRELARKQRHVQRLLMASFSIAEADVDGAEQPVRELLHREFERVQREADTAGFPDLYRDTVRLLTVIADLTSEAGYAQGG